MMNPATNDQGMASPSSCVSPLMQRLGQRYEDLVGPQQAQKTLQSPGQQQQQQSITYNTGSSDMLIMPEIPVLPLSDTALGFGQSRVETILSTTQFRRKASKSVKYPRNRPRHGSNRQFVKDRHHEQGRHRGAPKPKPKPLSARSPRSRKYHPTAKAVKIVQPPSRKKYSSYNKWAALRLRDGGYSQNTNYNIHGPYLSQTDQYLQDQRETRRKMIAGPFIVHDHKAAVARKAWKEMCEIHCPGPYRPNALHVNREEDKLKWMSEYNWDSTPGYPLKHDG